MTSPVLSRPTNLNPPAKFPESSFLNRFLFFGTFGLLLFGPLAFGTTEPWSIFIQQTGAAILFVLWVLQQFRTGTLEIVGNPLFWPMSIFAALVLMQLAAGWTVYRHATYSHMLLYVGYGILCFLAAQCLRRTHQVKLLTMIFSVYGCGLALFAVLQSASSTTRIFWLRTPKFGGWIYGPYVNHNHYAGLMEMLVPIPLVFAMSRRNAHGTRRRMAIGAAAIMTASVFLSGSRGGMLSITVEILVLLLVIAFRQHNRKTAWPIAAFLVVLVGLLLWLGGSVLIGRIATMPTKSRTDLSTSLRLAINHDAMRMFYSRPILGWGLGNFATAYPQFRSFYTNDLVDQAHNDYLQLLVETGILGFATMLWFIFSMYRYAIPKLRNWDHDVNGSITLAAMLGCTGILAHSFVDFNLQIPANAALFYVLAIFAAAPPCFGFSRRNRIPIPSISSTSVPLSQES